jgi:hypothetical protein
LLPFPIDQSLSIQLENPSHATDRTGHNQEMFSSHRQTWRPISCSYGYFGSCLHFNSHAVIWASGASQCHMKIHRPILL